ncbi:FAD binding domain-containing protein [Catenuloplanes atrovinosus]|uniref:Xanthine dehydrogenase YagS FAD-binding subunit n=1 Tax=Catenuloplanes atrovinosus TaxID=137266 RepID=A0AAE3YKX9_9ACTN|nr:xanthine dehydrogenase family protein subunit M [Catenuloplanes atrovinosus]MDR7275360.1 xanthine dehydrogenase YagS FAD-binding subunit [Catenuloplanes atrovinosus]
MHNFTYHAPTTTPTALTLATRPGTRYIAGGTDLLNLMKDGVQRHDQLIDINRLPLHDIHTTPHRIRLGALATMATVAAHPQTGTLIPLLPQTLLAGASPQIRNMATIGGNLLQRTRCWYFRDDTMPCNKRQPGTGCAALQGHNRWHAIIGGSDHCIAVHPSDLAVTLTALNATIHTQHTTGPRTIPIRDFYRPPGNTPHLETTLRHGELITAVDVPVTGMTGRYLKLRDRATFEFAVVSVAALIRTNSGIVREASLAFGGIAPIPWRSTQAEQALIGRRLDDTTITAAGRALVASATPQEHNAFKIPLVQRALTSALEGMR